MPHSQTLVEFVRAVNRSGGTYHRIDFGEGLVMQGEYDMDSYWPQYGLPDEMHGLSVLDVGTASGYFARECWKRGANVTAIDVQRGDFQRIVFADTSIRYVQMNVFDLTPGFGRFDIVLCGSLLLHVWDQVGVLRKLRECCRDLVVVATGILPPERDCDRFPAAELVGVRAVGGDGEYWTTWMPNPLALERMMTAAGFAEVAYLSGFHLRSVPSMNNFDTPHGVVHGRVRSATR
jgi:SAM-dependent methyltransferase